MDNHSKTKTYFNAMIGEGIFMKDKTRYSIASKEQWKNKTKEQKREHMSMMAKARWSKKTLEERREHALKMVKAKKLCEN